MPVTGILYRLAFGGTHYSLDEWSCSLHLSGSGAPILTPEIYAPALSAWWADAGAMHGTQSKLEYIKLNVINPLTGKYLSTDESFTHLLPAPVVGANGTGPPQCTVAISLLTDFTRGRGHAGRIFPPTVITQGEIDGSGRFSLGNQSAITTAAVTMLNAINAAAEPKVVIFSKLAQTVELVTGVAVGRVIDTQRRRRSSLVEAPVRAEIA